MEKLAVTAEEKRAVYEGVKKTLQSHPAYNCIAHHCYEMVSEPALLEEVRRCKHAKSRPLKRGKKYIDYVKEMSKQCNILKLAVPHSVERHYRASGMTQRILDEMYKKKSDKYCHPMIKREV